MNVKTIALRLMLSLGAALTVNMPAFSESTLQSSQEQSLYNTDFFYRDLVDQVHTCVDYNQNIPLKEEIHQLLEVLQNSQYVSEAGPGDFKAKFLLAQGCIEHVLSCSQILGKITQLTGVVHMPLPAAPLCVNLEDPALGGLLDASTLADPDKLFTVRSRPQMARDYLANGGVLFVAYPKSGIAIKTFEQRDHYFRAVEQYSTVLYDVPLETNSMDPNLIGATYAFKHENQWYIFSMKARQAGTTEGDSEWALWLGKINQPIILARVNAICEYLQNNQGPNLKQFILKGGK